MKVTISPDWNRIEEVRQQFENYLQGEGISDESTQLVEMVVSELIENAIKYGQFVDGQGQIEINLAIDANRVEQVVLEVSNRIAKESLEHLNKLDRMIQWVRGFQDPFEAYITRLKIVANHPLDDEESGLGIVRIAYEGSAVLDFILSEEEFVTVSAVIPVEKIEAVKERT